MRVLVLAKEGNQSATATSPTPDAMAEYQKFNQELIRAGVVVGSGRLSPSAEGKRLRFDGQKRTESIEAFEGAGRLELVGEPGWVGDARFAQREGAETDA